MGNKSVQACLCDETEREWAGQTYRMAGSRYKAVSLFSGAMGLDLGIECTGRFDLLACVEKERSFCETIRLNQRAGRLPKETRIYECDIWELSPKTLMDECGLVPGELDLLIGGPPCQTFSTAGRRGTIQDPRGMLLWRFLAFVEVMQPKLFVIENVRGLVSAALRHRPMALRPERGGDPLDEDEEPGSVLRRLATDLQGCGTASYHLDCFEVNAVNYGVPQLRERVLLVGNRYNRRVSFPGPTHGPGGSDLFLLPWRTLGDAIGGLNDPGDVILDFSPRKKEYLSLVPEGSNWRSLPIEIQKESMGRAWHAKGGRSGWWRRLSYDLPCPALVTMPNHASTSLCHPTEVRALSLREYALIQEFPKDWEFYGTATQQYAQVGNAVPIRLGRVTGSVVAETLGDLAKRGWQRDPGELEAYRLVYIQSHVRTRRWYRNGKTEVWVNGESNEKVRYAPPVTQWTERAIGVAR